MTTIIVIVVVALVFFVTVCVVTLMIWKRETEMRTDSLRAIEQNLQEMLNEMNDGRQSKSWTGRHEDEAEGTAGKIVEVSRAGSRDKTVRRKSADPFAWVKAQGTGDKNLKTEKEKETAEDKIHKILRWTTVMNDKACEEPDESTQSDKGKFVLAEEKEIFPAEEEKIALHEEDAVHIEEAAAVKLEETAAESAKPVKTAKPAETLKSAEPAEITTEPTVKKPEQAEEIVHPDVTALDSESSGHLTLDESFREIENLIKGLTEDVMEYERTLELKSDSINDGVAENSVAAGKETDVMQDLQHAVESSPELTEILKIFNEENAPEPVQKPAGYDTGRSGRKYTAEELEMLIKE